MESSFNAPMFIWLLITIVVLYMLKLAVEALSPPYCEEKQQECDMTCDMCPHFRLKKRKK